MELKPVPVRKQDCPVAKLKMTWWKTMESRAGERLGTRSSAGSPGAVALPSPANRKGLQAFWPLPRAERPTLKGPAWLHKCEEILPRPTHLG